MSPNASNRYYMRLCVFRASSVFAKQKQVATQATGGGVLGERGGVRSGGGGGEVRARGFGCRVFIESLNRAGIES